MLFRYREQYPASRAVDCLPKHRRPRNVYYVVGAVAKPGVYTLEAGLGVLEAIAIAGGTLTDGESESRVMVNSKIGEYANVYTINMEKQMKQGNPQRYLLRSEDAIVVPEKSAAFLGSGFNALRDVLTFGHLDSTSTILADRSGTNNEPAASNAS